MTERSLLNENLTDPYAPEMRQRLQHTFPGQASWADPTIGRSCCECTFWGRKTFDRDANGDLTPKRCYKRASLQRGIVSTPVPFNAFACRLFVAGENRPPIERPEKKQAEKGGRS